jgi:hypothetical protein
MDVDKDARDILSELAEGRTEEQYRDIIWAMRYPVPPPKASASWPYKSLEQRMSEEVYNKKVTRLR